MITNGMMSSNTDLWSTPEDLFNELNDEYHFDLDVCADETNHKCARYYTEKQDGLSQKWDGTVWCNPPYGRKIAGWIKRCYEYGTTGGIAVMLIPSRTDTKWWHSYVMKASEIQFIKGRLKFGNSKNCAPFPSAIVIFSKSNSTAVHVCTREHRSNT